MSKHYIITHEFFNEATLERNISPVIVITHNKEKALKIFRELVEDEKNSVKDKEYKTLIDDDDCFYSFSTIPVCDSAFGYTEVRITEEDVKEEKYVWAVEQNWVVPSGESGNSTEIFATFEAAKNEFDKLVNEDKNVNYAYEYAHPEDSSCSWEEEGAYWCIWKNDNYCTEHSEIKLLKKLVIANS